MKTGQLSATYVKAVLEFFQLPATPVAVQLLVMIAAHESGGFHYVKQPGNGPARGLFQIEPIGLQEVVRYSQLRSTRFPLLPDLAAVHVNQLVFDTCLAIAVSRVFFMARPEPLPAVDDIEGLARYAKKYWNTEAGKATA